MEPVQEFCLSGCGFFGSPATEGHCSVCYKKIIIKKQLSSAIAEVLPAVTCSNVESAKEPTSAEFQKETPVAVADSEAGTSDPEKPKKRNRCFTCRKKVGLTGFDCRCGGVFCGLHRYSDMHQCSFDYRKMAAQEIRTKNPVIVSAKVQKI